MAIGQGLTFTSTTNRANYVCCGQDPTGCNFISRQGKHHRRSQYQHLDHFLPGTIGDLK